MDRYRFLATLPVKMTRQSGKPGLFPDTAGGQANAGHSAFFRNGRGSIPLNPLVDVQRLFYVFFMSVSSRDLDYFLVSSNDKESPFKLRTTSTTAGPLPAKCCVHSYRCPGNMFFLRSHSRSVKQGPGVFGRKPPSPPWNGLWSRKITLRRLSPGSSGGWERPFTSPAFSTASPRQS